jgi:peptidoglycan/LPS O-acetylase OafA/YrhL
MSATEVNSRNVSIDALRTVSIFLVLIAHGGGIANIPAISICAPQFQVGYYGVTLFFVISGYLITTGLLRRYSALSQIQLGEFYLFRASRIGPGVCTENPIRVDDVMESPKLAE